MRHHWQSLFLICGLIYCASAESSRAETTAAKLKDESELGIVITSGNSKASTLNIKQQNTYHWRTHLITLNGFYLSTTTRDTLSAKSWQAGIRYDQELSPRLSAYLGQNVESDLFAGNLQRYNSDIGGKYFLNPTEHLNWSLEAGYRYTIENLLDGTQNHKSFLRGFTEVEEKIKENLVAKLAIEYLGNVSDSSDYRINVEPSLNTALSEIFSLKVGYQIHFLNHPLPGAELKTDSIFTTALVAKF